MARQIILNVENRMKLKDRFSVSNSTITGILHFRRINRRASEVRSYAVNKLNGMMIEV